MRDHVFNPRDKTYISEGIPSHLKKEVRVKHASVEKPMNAIEVYDHIKHPGEYNRIKLNMGARKGYFPPQMQQLYEPYI